MKRQIGWILKIKLGTGIVQEHGFWGAFYPDFDFRENYHLEFLFRDFGFREVVHWQFQLLRSLSGS